MMGFLDALFGPPKQTSRPAGAWLAAKQSAHVWGDLDRREVKRPARPYDWAEEEEA